MVVIVVVVNGLLSTAGLNQINCGKWMMVLYGMTWHDMACLIVIYDCIGTYNRIGSYVG